MQTNPILPSPPKTDIEQSVNAVLSIKASTAAAGNKSGSSSTNNGKVNEQDMFAAIIHHELGKESPSAVKAFEQRFTNLLERFSANGVKDFMFKAAKRALRSVRRRGMLAPEDAKSIRRTAFGKAQLDSDRTRLSTEAVTGIDGDIPIQPIQSALVKFAQNEAASPDEMQAARQAQEVQRAAAKPSAASAKSSSSGAPDLTPEIDEPDAPQGFLWKPYSESDGNLVVLLPPSWKGIQKAVIRTPNGNVYDGRNTGIHNGDRVHFRFSQPGREFPPGSTVEVTMNDGSVRKVTVQNTAYRVV